MNNVARYLPEAATRDPHGVAIVAPDRRGGWERVTYQELDARADAIAHGLVAHGFERGQRTLVMVQAGIGLITLTYSMFKAGIVPVLIDPGMGRKAFLECVGRTRPTAFIGIPLAHLARILFPSSFRTVSRHVTVGRRLLWGGPTLDGLERAGRTRGRFGLAPTTADETAAILFTSGSTGPAKGAVYSHGNFEAQVRFLGEAYRFAPGEVDLAAFPLFSLFDCAFGMTSVIPELDPSRPGSCDPAKVVAAIRQHGATTAFGSPAIWRRVAPHCLSHGVRLSKLKRVLIAGASVPPTLIRDLHAILGEGGDVATPYGATEALPVSSIAGREVIGETAARSREGAGTCVGRPAPGIQVAIIRITDEPIATWAEAQVCPDGETGELCVRGAVVTKSYDNHPEATRLAKIQDHDGVWHRMGDLAYRDAEGRLWFCGRKSERLRTAEGPMFTDRIEGIFTAHPRVGRCALVGVGKPQKERPVLVVEGREDAALARELRSLGPVDAVLFHPRFPVDVRHNAKIHRRTLKAWAERQLGRDVA